MAAPGWKPGNVEANAAALRKELGALDGKIAHLTTAVEDGAALPSLIEKLRQRHVEREALLVSIAAAEAVSQHYVDRDKVVEEVLAQVDGWRELLKSDGRQGLREALDGPIEFRPEGKTYRFEGKTVTGELITACVTNSTRTGVPNGIGTPVELAR